MSNGSSGENVLEEKMSAPHTAEESEATTKDTKEKLIAAGAATGVGVAAGTATATGAGVVGTAALNAAGFTAAGIAKGSAAAAIQSAVSICENI